MLAWLRDLTSRERRTMLACWGGWTLDGFDQQLYSYVMPTVWGMSTAAAGTIVTVVTSSFGGWFAGALADRFGRVRVQRLRHGRPHRPFLPGQPGHQVARIKPLLPVTTLSLCPYCTSRVHLTINLSGSQPCRATTGYRRPW
jgi:MFS family permease